jgi:hypothetical protein
MALYPTRPSSSYKMFVSKPQGKRSFERSENYVRIILKLFLKKQDISV